MFTVLKVAYLKTVLKVFGFSLENDFEKVLKITTARINTIEGELDHFGRIWICKDLDQQTKYFSSSS